MGAGGLDYTCPNCETPLFFTFRVADARDGIRKDVHCPGCRTPWVVDLKVAAKEGAPA